MADNFLPKSMGTDFGKRGLFLAAKIGPAGPILAAQWSGGTGFGTFFAKISPAGPILWGTDFGVTGQNILQVLLFPHTH